MSSPSLKTTFKELEKYVKHMFFKTSQIIIQSRQGGKSSTESQPNPKSQSWFSLAINDNAEISHEAKRVLAHAQVSSGQGLLAAPICIEISLKTTEGDLLVMENWVLSKDDRTTDPNVRPNTVYNQMGLLLKSILCVSRVLPAYKFARRQGPDTHVMCYRIFAGEPNSNPLGKDYQTACVGQVVTGFGTILVRVDFRTQMTISHHYSSNESLGLAQQKSGGSNQSAPIWAKSDHFTSAENLDHIIRKNVNEYSDNSGNIVTTSDESSEAMRIFAASPPEPHFVHKRFSDHYSSNESLGVQKFRSRSNTNQSHKSDADESSGGGAANEVKIGAFATRKVSHEHPTTATTSVSAEDDFLELFNLEDDRDGTAEKIEQLATKSKVPILSKSPAKRAILFPEESEEIEDSTKPQHQPSNLAVKNLQKKKNDFVLLNTPFSLASNPEYRGNNPEGDLGVFFKEVQAAPQLKATVLDKCNDMTDASLEAQLTSLCDDLSLYENKSEEYEELLATLQTTATTTSESESEAS